MKYVWKDLTGWHSQTIDQIDWSMMQLITSLALDDERNQHVCYMRNGYELVIRHWDGSQWNLETVDSDSQVGMHPSMVLDTSNRPRISYYDITHGDLKYARLLPDQSELTAHLLDGQLLLT